jgi:hypothetical protein
MSFTLERSPVWANKLRKKKKGEKKGGKKKKNSNLRKKKIAKKEVEGANSGSLQCTYL